MEDTTALEISQFAESYIGYSVIKSAQENSSSHISSGEYEVSQNSEVSNEKIEVSQTSPEIEKL